MTILTKMKQVALSCVVLTGMTLGSVEAQQNQEILKYIEPVVLDEFNPDVTDEMRENMEPKRGGEFRLRAPSDFGNLNPLMSKSQSDGELNRLIHDALIAQDDETQEFVPLMAISFAKGDLFKKADGEVMFGTLVKMGDESDPESTVEFIPGALRRTYFQYDVESVDEAAGTLTLKEQAGGKTLKGKITKNFFTYEVDESASEENQSKKITAKISELAPSSADDASPFQKQECYFTFDIRDGIQWHDGKPFTAEDVKFSFDVITNPDTDVQRLRAYYVSVESCNIINDGKTVEFYSTTPYFQQFAFLGGINLVPKHVFNPDQYGGDNKAFAEAFNEHPYRRQPVGTGPYQFTEWKKDNYLTITRAPNYWASKLPDGAVFDWKKEQPYFDSIKFIIIPEKSVALKELQLGSIDADMDIEPDTWNNDQTNNEELLAEYIRAESFGFLYTYIAFNNDDPVLKDKSVRQAIAHLIPRERIIKDIYYGVATPVSGPFYLKGPGYNKDVELIEYDPRTATRILRRGGWLDRDGDGVAEKEIDGKIVKLELEYMIHTARDYHAKVADIIKESVEQAGISLTVRKLDFNTVLEKTQDRDFQMARIAWGTGLDPDPFQIWHSSQIENRGSNYAGFRNAEADQLMEDLRQEFSAPKRWEMARRIHEIIAEEQPVIFLEGFYELYLINRDIHGIKFYPSQYPQNYREWWWADAARRSGE